MSNYSETRQVNWFSENYESFRSNLVDDNMQM